MPTGRSGRRAITRARCQDYREVRGAARFSRGGSGSSNLLAALKLRDLIGQLEYKVAYFASLWYDQDQRDNQIDAKQQQVQILFARDAQASAWFNPELLKVPLDWGAELDGGEFRRWP